MTSPGSRPALAGRDVALASADGHVHAAVDAVGAGLRVLTVGGVDVVEPYPAGTRPPYAAGAVLFPWPNRVRDGRWWSDGVEHRLVVDEPERDAALHGLVRHRTFAVADRRPDRVVLRTVLDRPPGYPFTVGLTLGYRVVADGLAAEARAQNLGPTPAPMAFGVHPYLRVGDVPTDALVLDVDAASVLDVDERLLPVGERPVAGTGVDPRGLPLAGAALNHCYGALTASAGWFRHRLRAPDGRTVELRADESFGWVQVYACPGFPRAGERVAAVAVEPMTAPPDALNSGAGLTHLAPGEEWSARWSVHLGG